MPVPAGSVFAAIFVSNVGRGAFQDMPAFVGRLQAIARETGAAVLVVHHPGKDDTRGMCGSMVLFAACDDVIKIIASGNIREVATEKVKEGESKRSSPTD